MVGFPLASQKETDQKLGSLNRPKTISKAAFLLGILGNVPGRFFSIEAQGGRLLFSTRKPKKKHHLSHNQNPVLKWLTQNHVKN